MTMTDDVLPQEVWNRVQASLQGLDTTTRDFRRRRQKLYSEFITDSINSMLENKGFDPVGSLMRVVKQGSFLNEKVARDKVLRDDYLRLVCARFDKLIQDPLEASETKLEAVRAIYDHAKAYGPQNGGVTETWAVRTYREARREYALDILRNPNDQLQKYLNGRSEFSEYLRKVHAEGKEMKAKEAPAGEQVMTAVPMEAVSPVQQESVLEVQALAEISPDEQAPEQPSDTEQPSPVAEVPPQNVQNTAAVEEAQVQPQPRKDLFGLGRFFKRK